MWRLPSSASSTRSALPRKRTKRPSASGRGTASRSHQLSPKAYYDYSMAKCQKFIDHDDKIEEDKLSTAFEWTSKVYQEAYGEVVALSLHAS